MAASGRSTVAAILVAAGAGQRLGADVPKAFVQIAGRTLLDHSIAAFVPRPVGDPHDDLDLLVVVAPTSSLADADAAVGRVASAWTVPVRVVAGGADRQASVAAGLAAAGDVDHILVHDVARPFVSASVIAAVLSALRAGAQAVVPVVAIHDTVRRIGASGELGEIVDRATLRAVQTPQGFVREVLVEAHRTGAGLGAGDDAGLVERLGVPVVAVAGSDDAFKITTAADLARAEAVARLRYAPPGPRFPPRSGVRNHPSSEGFAR